MVSRTRRNLCLALLTAAASVAGCDALFPYASAARDATPDDQRAIADGDDRPDGAVADRSAAIDQGPDASGPATVHTVAGQPGTAGHRDGPGPQSLLSEPAGIAVDDRGWIYVTEEDNHTVRAIAPDGTVSTVAGAPGIAGWQDDSGGAARFNAPAGVVIGPDRTLYVADYRNHLVRAISDAGVVTTIAGTGTAGERDGAALGEARFNGPHGLALAGDALFVGDLTGQRLRRIDLATSTVSTVTDHIFYGPSGLALDAAGNVLVADEFRCEISRVVGGTVSTAVGAADCAWIDGPEAAARFERPCDVAVSPAGPLFIVEFIGARVRRWDAGTVSTVVGTRSESYQDGPAASARLTAPHSIALDAQGRLYVTDFSAHVVARIDL